MPDQTSYHVLMVDDNEAEYMLAQEFLIDLDSNSIALSWCASADDALLAIKEETYDAYLIDYYLGAQNGLEIIESAHASGCRAPLILLTGQGDPEIDQKALAAGAADYLEKGNLSGELLERAVRYAIERKSAENAQKLGEQRLAGLVANLPDGVCLLDDTGCLLIASTVALEHLKVLAGDVVIGDRIESIGHLSLMELVADSANNEIHEIVIGGPPKCVFECRLNALSDMPVTQGWSLVIRDVTHEREVQERIQQQDRLAAVGQMAAGIAHDFNNLLTSIVGNAQLLELREETPDVLRSIIGGIATQGMRAADLIRQILDFSRKTVAQRSAVALMPFVEETVGLLKRTLREDIQIVTELDDDECWVDANPTQLQQVITNLAVNAQDAMSGGGTFRISLEKRNIQKNVQSPLPDMTPGTWVVLCVSDTGTGMHEDVLEHIFEPFFTTKGPGKGTGLGMAQVYGIVKQHSGEIDIESEIGKGTTFTIYLPSVIAPGEADEIVIPDMPMGHGETILVVEDDHTVRVMLEQMLQHLNYLVLTAQNGKEALAMYNAHRDDIRLILTDVVMPEMGGIELFDALRQLDDQVCVVLMSGYPLGVDKDLEQLPDGLKGFMQKPPEIDQIANTIAKVLM